MNFIMIDKNLSGFFFKSVMLRNVKYVTMKNDISKKENVCYM